MIGATVASVMRQIRDYENSEGYMPRVWIVGPQTRKSLEDDIRAVHGILGAADAPPRLLGQQLLGAEILP
jgi:hypothetical protein